jgi:hypothetical protein
LVKFVGGLPAGFKAAKLLTDLTALKYGGDVMLAGYGISDGAAHTGAAILRSVVTQIKTAAFSKTEVLMDQTHGKGACHGDSGGPAYDTINGEQLLFGVTSRGVDDPSNDCTRFSAYTAIPAYAAWVKSTMTALNGSDVPVPPTTPVATPTTQPAPPVAQPPVAQPPVATAPPATPSTDPTDMPVPPHHKRKKHGQDPTQA